MKTTRAHATITHEEIAKAIDHFLKEGKKITVLPTQIVIKKSVIDEKKWGAYESLDDVDL